MISHKKPTSANHQLVAIRDLEVALATAARWTK